MKPLASGTRVWERQAEHACLRLQSESQVPFGQDRAILIVLSTIALQQRKPYLQLGSAAQILHLLNLAPDGRNYARLAERFDRLLRCQFHLTLTAKNAPIHQSTFFVQQKSNLWCHREDRDTHRFVNSVTLSRGFWNELRRAPVPLDLRIVRQLLNSPGALDFYLWIRWRAGRVRPGCHLRLPVLGPDGLAEQLSIGDYAHEGDIRRQVLQWLTKTANVWPNCPAVMSSDGQSILICGSPVKAPVLPGYDLNE